MDWQGALDFLGTMLAIVILLMFLLMGYWCGIHIPEMVDFANNLRF